MVTQVKVKPSNSMDYLHLSGKILTIAGLMHTAHFDFYYLRDEDKKQYILEQNRVETVPREPVFLPEP